MGCSIVGDSREERARGPIVSSVRGAAKRMDQSKKTMRHFYCRDVLWETFEQMANDFDCSIDYLVNEAMRYYARSKNYQSPGGPPVTSAAPAVNPNNTGGPTAYPPPGSGKPGGNGMRGQPST